MILDEINYNREYCYESPLCVFKRSKVPNHCLDFVRSAYKKYIPYPGEEAADYAGDDSDTDGEYEYLEKYGTKTLLAAMMKLRPDYRVILNLYAVEGMNHQQISASLGIQESTSRSKLMRARNSLKKILNQPGK